MGKESIQKEEKNKGYTVAVGRRKEAVARVRLAAGNGITTVNGKPIHEYFKGKVYQKYYQKPFEITKSSGEYSASILLAGGGISSQVGAVVHGLSRALALTDRENFRKLLKKEGLLTRDARVKERRKYGHAQKARAMKQSPKR